MIDAERSCPTCAAPVAAGDAFCEACGHELIAAPAVGPAGIAPATPPADPTSAGGADDTEHQRTHLLVPDGGAAAARTCVICGSPIADDGFCSVCGAKARLPRDHWVESPSDWVGGVCDKGISHARNEDAMALSSLPAPTFAVLVVCDGVTSAPESDRASLAASKAACAMLTAAARPTGSVASRISVWQATMAAACAAANAEAVAVARTLGDPPEPPSSTFVAAVKADDLIAVAWCGDSRAYWLADDPATRQQLSIDHSLGTEMMLNGRSRAEAEADPTCHTITRWLGADSIDPTSEFRALTIDRPGWLAVVSDGMWNYASSADELVALIATAQAAGAATPTSIAESLAAYANECGGHDNITVALARCDVPLP